MPKFYSVQRKVSLQQSVQMAYIAIKTSKIIKLHELTLLKRGNLGKITKFGGGGGGGGGEGGVLAKEQTIKKHFCILMRSAQIFSFFCYSFLLNYICNVEFDSNFSCLDRFNKFGIDSLQKL